MKKYKVSIVLKDREIVIFLSERSARDLIDQIYDVFSGEFDDNCIEVISDEVGSRETLIVKADEVIYVKTQEVLSNE